MMDDQPRPQYYVYAHRVLPSLFFNDPKAFLTTLATDGIAFLRFFWDRTAQSLEGVTTVPAIGLNYETRALDDGTIIAVIEMPAPDRVTECHFVAAVYRSANEDDALLMRYFTLEYSLDFMSQGERTVLCEWSSDGNRHMNYGDGPEAKSKPFLDAVVAHLAA
jgi:hypothetical protein